MRWKPPVECGIDNRPENYRKNRSVINSSNKNNWLSEDEYHWLTGKNYSRNYFGIIQFQDFKYDLSVCSIELPKKLAVEFLCVSGN